MDKQGRIGMMLLIGLLAAYLFYNQSQQTAFLEKKKVDSIAAAKINPPVQAEAPMVGKDTIKKIVTAKDSTALPEQLFVLENELMKVTFSSAGAQPIEVLLKKYKNALDSNLLKVFSKGQNQMDFYYKNTTGSMLHTKDVAFAGAVNKNILSFTNAAGPSITYTLPDNSYMLNIGINGNNTIDASNTLAMQWNAIAPNTEYDAVNEIQYNTVVFNETKEGTDYNKLLKERTNDFKEGLVYLGFKQHYFNTTFVAVDKDFVAGKYTAKPTNDTTNKTVASLNAGLTFAAGQTTNVNMYIGPNDYKLLKSYGKKMENMIPLEYSDFLSFIRYLNKLIILPLFDFLSGFLKNYGLVIMFLTIIIRLLMSPITYKSYVSSAKMKVLKPDIDALKAKYADDQQAFGVKQMELFRSAGVSPLGGCLPALAQLPIFFALLSFLPNALQLRQQPFLWAKDLSTFDVILKLPFTIPAYGNHVSLWTLLFVITSLILALYSMSSTPTDNSNPMLKYMPFIMPVIFLGVFNKMPAALTFYYVVSNLFTILLQWFITNYVIDHAKIRAQIDENKTKGPKTNKFMERMAEMQKQNAERMKKTGK